jgi:transposase
MSQVSDELKKEAKKTIDLLKTMRDEIKVKLHLAGQEAKDRWQKIEPEIEKAGNEVAKTSKATIDELVTRVKEFKKDLIG